MSKGLAETIGKLLRQIVCASAFGIWQGNNPVAGVFMFFVLVTFEGK